MLAKLIMRIQFLDECGSTYTVTGTGVLWASAYCFLICNKLSVYCRISPNLCLSCVLKFGRKYLADLKYGEQYIPTKYPTKFSTA